MPVAVSPPMTCLSTQDALDFIVERQLVSTELVDELKSDLNQLPSGEEVIDEFIRRGKMTQYQKEQILSGQGDRLCFGPFRLLKPLGEGGMGEVFKAWQPRLDRLIALKFILPEYLDKQSLALNRFQREAKAIAQLQHPNIIVLYDADEIDGIPFIAMEYVDGVSLVDMVRKTGPLSVKRACDYMRQAAHGLQHAFENGFVHRDIKPSNIMVSPTKKKAGAPVQKDKSLVTMHDIKRLSERDGSWTADRIKILDMGLARLNESMTKERTAATPLTAMGAVVGTPDYVAPEQARDSSKVDIRADLYSLGCTFYFILTGRVPFPGGTALEKMIKHQCDEAAPLKTVRRDIPQSVATIVERLMAKKPEDRYQTPMELADAISNYLTDPNPNSGQPPQSGSHSGTTKLQSDSKHPVTPKPGSDSRLLGETAAQSVILLAPGAAPKRNIPGLCETMTSLDQVDFETAASKQVFWESVPVLETKRVRTAKIRPLALLNGHLGAISAVSVTPNGRLAATADVNGQMRIWDIHTCQREIDRRFHKSEIQAIALPPDNPKHLVFGELRGGKIVLCRLNWRVDSLVDLIELSSLGQKGIHSLNFTSDGGMLAAGVGSLAVVWTIVNDTATNRRVLRGVDQPIQAIAVSPDRRMVVAAGQDKALYFWNLGVANWTSKAIRVKTQIAAVNTLRFSPDGSMLALAGLDNRIVLWPMIQKPDEPVRILRGHASNVQHIQFIDNGNQLASVGTDGQVLYWDLQKRSIARECFLELALAYRMEMSEDGSRLVAGFTNGSVGVYCPSESD